MGADGSLSGTESARRRRLLRAALARLDKVLDETEEAITRLHPKKHDKLTSGSYHSCAHHPHWALNECLQIQELAISLEAHDSDGLFDPAVAVEYAFLAVDIVARRDQAHQLLRVLCGSDLDLQAASTREGSRFSTAISEWMTMAVMACGGRGCIS